LIFGMIWDLFTPSFVSDFDIRIFGFS